MNREIHEPDDDRQRDAGGGATAGRGGVLTDSEAVPSSFHPSPSYEAEAWRPFPVYDLEVWGEEPPTLRQWLVGRLHGRRPASGPGRSSRRRAGRLETPAAG
jgi:hypothetical protein